MERHGRLGFRAAGWVASDGFWVWVRLPGGGRYIQAIACNRLPPLPCSSRSPGCVIYDKRPLPAPASRACPPEPRCPVPERVSAARGAPGGRVRPACARAASSEPCATWRSAQAQTALRALPAPALSSTAPLIAPAPATRRLAWRRGAAGSLLRPATGARGAARQAAAAALGRSGRSAMPSANAKWYRMPNEGLLVLSEGDITQWSGDAIVNAGAAASRLRLQLARHSCVHAAWHAARQQPPHCCSPLLISHTPSLASCLATACSQRAHAGRRRRGRRCGPGSPQHSLYCRCCLICACVAPAAAWGACCCPAARAHAPLAHSAAWRVLPG